jgi:hypothetical protein
VRGGSELHVQRSAARALEPAAEHQQAGLTAGAVPAPYRT